MSDAIPVFHDLSCSSCGGPGLEAEGERVICRYCGAQYAEARSFCVNCQHVNRQGAAFCENCGDPLARACPACRENNWIGAEYCGNCGQPLDILEYLYQRHRHTTAETLRKAREEARALKEQEDVAAERRSRQLWAFDNRVQEARDQAVAKQAARDRTTMGLLLAGALLFVMALIVAGALLAAR